MSSLILSNRWSRLIAIALAGGMAIGLTGPVAAQKKATGPAASGVVNPLGNFSANSKAPIDIEADTVQMFDQKKMAVLRGNVKAVQGDFELRTVEMEVYYEDKAQDGKAAKKPAADPAGKPAVSGAQGSPGASQIKRMVAKEKVVLTGKDGQTASGDWADYDAKEQIAIIGGNVILTKEKNIVKGERLRIDLKTGESRFEPGVPGGEPTPVAAARPDSKSLPTRKEIGKQAPPAGASPRPSAVFYPGDLQAQAKTQAGHDTGAGKDGSAQAAKPPNQATAGPQTSEWAATTSETPAGPHDRR